MTKAKDSNWFNDFVVSINYGTINPMSWGIWMFNKNKYERLISYYYDSSKEGFQKTDEIYIYEIFQELIEISSYSFAHSTVVFLIEPSAAGFIENLKRLAETRYNAKIKIVPYKRPLPDLNDYKSKHDLFYTIRLCLSNNVIKLPFNVYRTVENYPDRMLQEISMFLSVSSLDLSTDEKADKKNNETVDNQELQDIKTLINTYEERVIELKSNLRCKAERIEKLFAVTYTKDQLPLKDFHIVEPSRYKEYYETIKDFYDTKDEVDKLEYLILAYKQHEQELQGHWVGYYGQD